MQTLLGFSAVVLKVTSFSINCRLEIKVLLHNGGS